MYGNLNMIVIESRNGMDVLLFWAIILYISIGILNNDIK